MLKQEVGTNDSPLRCPACGHHHQPGESVFLFGMARVTLFTWPGGAEDIEIGGRPAAYCGAACVQDALAKATSQAQPSR